MAQVHLQEVDSHARHLRIAASMTICLPSLLSLWSQTRAHQTWMTWQTYSRLRKNSRSKIHGTSPPTKNSTRSLTRGKVTVAKPQTSSQGCRHKKSLRLARITTWTITQVNSSMESVPPEAHLRIKDWYPVSLRACLEGNNRMSQCQPPLHQWTLSRVTWSMQTKSRGSSATSSTLPTTRTCLRRPPM